NVDGGLRLRGRQRARRVWVLERKILDILAKHAELRLVLLSAWARRGSAIAGGRHRLYLTLPIIAAVAAWLTQPLRPDEEFARAAWNCRGGRSLVFSAGWRRPLPRGGCVEFPPLRHLIGGTSGAFDGSALKPGKVTKNPAAPARLRRSGRWSGSPVRKSAAQGLNRTHPNILGQKLEEPMKAPICSRQAVETCHSPCKARLD